MSHNKEADHINTPLELGPAVSPGIETDTKGDEIVEVLKTESEIVPLKSNFDALSKWEAAKQFRWSVLIAGLAAFSAATDGYQSQLTSSIVAFPGFVRQFGFYDTSVNPAVWKLDPVAVSTFGGLFSAGMVVGQSTINFVHGWYGRKGAMWTFMALITLAVVIECVSTVWWHFTLAKLVSGIGIGAVQATLPVYINEHAPMQIRGAMIVGYNLMYTLGGLACSIGLTVLKNNAPADWKTPIYSQFAMIGCAVIIYWFLPESPWWLVGKGRMEQARKVLTWKNRNILNYNVEEELSVLAMTIAAQNEYDREQNAQSGFAIFQGLNLKRFLIGSWPKVLQQFVGLGVFSSYSTYFFSLAGNSNPFNVTVIMGCLSLLAAVLDATFVDWIGRRRMTLFGFGGACTGMILMAIVGCLDYKNPQLGAVLVFAGAMANFCNTFQSTTSYAYLTEMPEERFRARATGLGLAFCNLFAVLFNFTIPIMLNVWVVKTAWLFVCLGVPGTILAYFIMPESCGRSPAEIHEMFVEGVNLRKWKGHVTQVERDWQAARAPSGYAVSPGAGLGA